MSSEVTIEQRLAMVERYQQTQGNTLSAHNDALNAAKIDAARREERDEALNERLKRIEKAIGGIYKLGWWILAAFGSAFIALLANFIFRGGMIT